METTLKVYAPLLERVERELDLPQPEKSLVLAELAADAAGLHAHLRSRGAAEAEVRRQVELWLAAAPETIRQLEAIHRPMYLRWAHRLSEPRRHRLERLFLGLVVLCLAASSVPLAAGGGVLASAPYGSGWLVLGVGVVVAGTLLERAFTLWLRRDHRPERRRRGLELLLGAGMLAPALGALGAAAALSGLAQGSPGSGEVWGAVHVGSSLLAAGLMVGVLAGVVWFTVECRVRWLERLDHVWKEEER